MAVKNISEQIVQRRMRRHTLVGNDVTLVIPKEEGKIDGLVENQLHDYKDVIMEHLPTNQRKLSLNDVPGLQSPGSSRAGAKSDMGFNYQKDQEAKLNASLQRFEAIQEAREKKVRSSLS